MSRPTARRRRSRPDDAHCRRCSRWRCWRRVEAPGRNSAHMLSVGAGGGRQFGLQGSVALGGLANGYRDGAGIRWLIGACALALARGSPARPLTPDTSTAQLNIYANDNGGPQVVADGSQERRVSPPSAAPANAGARTRADGSRQRHHLHGVRLSGTGGSHTRTVYGPRPHGNGSPHHGPDRADPHRPAEQQRFVRIDERISYVDGTTDVRWSPTCSTTPTPRPSGFKPACRGRRPHVSGNDAALGSLIRARHARSAGSTRPKEARAPGASRLRGRTTRRVHTATCSPLSAE